MDINQSSNSIADLLNMKRRRELTVNATYQRGTGIWPAGARSYFIDTILSGFPFPKIYVYEFVDRNAGFAIKKELVDGQQRLATIEAYAADQFAVSGDSAFAGLRFSDLSIDKQEEFMSYTVSVDVIRNAKRPEILQMFRRMNAYTLPLNDAEKRHSTYHGDFKWFVNNLEDDLNEFLQEYGVYTNRQMVRMADSELIADVVLFIEQGLVSTSPKNLDDIYKRYDAEFPKKELYAEQIRSTFTFIVDHFEVLKETHMMKPYALHTLVCALHFNKYGNPRVTEALQFRHAKQFATSASSSAEALLALAQAHEAKETEGPHALYVWGATSGTNRISQRTARFIEVLAALGNSVHGRLNDQVVEAFPTSVRQASSLPALRIP